MSQEASSAESEVRPQFGSRYLTKEKDVFAHNAWDDVKWDEEQEATAKTKVSQNGIVKFSEEALEKFETEAEKNWDAFYDIHTNRFFKDRHWLFTEFPELHDEATKVIFEVGCGVGNTIFPILQNSKNKELFIYCCDFSEKAISILQDNPIFDASKCNAFVLDASEDDWKPPIEENSADVAVLIFVLSAIHPKKFETVARQIYRFVKPGGILLFRDYGRYDLAQLRFKPGRCLSENFYVRGDGTRVYFFTQEEVQKTFQDVGFEQIENRLDRRLQVNRGKLIKMYRVWIQAKFRKPVS